MLCFDLNNNCNGPLLTPHPHQCVPYSSYLYIPMYNITYK